MEHTLLPQDNGLVTPLPQVLCGMHGGRAYA
jgi:hypothetical protein